MPDKDGDDDKKSTKSVVNKKQKLGEEGYDIARDMGKVSPSKDKKDATTMPVSDEVKKTQKKSKGKSAVELVKAKYGKSVMNVGKKKANEELDLSKVAEVFGGYIVEATVEDPKKKKNIGSRKITDKNFDDIMKAVKGETTDVSRDLETVANRTQGGSQSRREKPPITGDSGQRDRPRVTGDVQTTKTRAPRKGVDYFFDPKKAKADRERTAAKRIEYEIDPKTNRPSDAGIEKYARKSKQSNLPLTQTDLDTAERRMAGTGEKGTDVGKYGGRMGKQMSPKNLQKLRKKLKADSYRVGDKPPEGSPSFEIPNRTPRTGEPKLPKFTDDPNPSFRKVASKVATAAKKSPVSPLIAYDLGKGIIGKITKLRMPSVQGGKAGFRSAGG